MVRFEFIETNKDFPWLLFIHGFSGNAGTWKNQIFEFKNKFNICLVDLPGHGNAELTEDEKSSKNVFLKVAQDIINTLKEKGINKVNIVSFSMGTVVNYFMLLEDLEFCEKSIMVSPVCGGNVFMNFKGNLMSILQSLLPFNFVVNCFVDFILPKKEDFDLKPEVRQACLDLGRDNFIFWYKSLKKHFNIMRERSLSDFKNIFVVSGDGDLNLKPGVEEVVKRYNLPFKLVENCSHLYPMQKREDFHAYLHSILD